MSTIEPTSLNDSPGLLLLYLRECSLWPGSGGAIIPEGAVAGALCGLEVVLLYLRELLQVFSVAWKWWCYYTPGEVKIDPHVDFYIY